MPVSTNKSTKTKAAPKRKESRAALEQRALEGRGHEVLKYLRNRGVVDLADDNLLHLSWLWLYCDPKRELTIDEFMDLTEKEIHDRFESIKSKNHLQKLNDFKKVIELYALEDGEVQIPYRYAT